MDIAEVEEEFRSLVLDRFDEADALRLGALLLAEAQAAALPVVIDIRTANRTLFHAALPGSAPLNDIWARRKSATALLFHLPSLLVGLRNQAKGEGLERHGLDAAGHSDSGGAVPIRVQGAGVVAVATVSGLPQVEDHRLVARGLRALIAGKTKIA